MPFSIGRLLIHIYQKKLHMPFSIGRLLIHIYQKCFLLSDLTPSGILPNEITFCDFYSYIRKMD